MQIKYIFSLAVLLAVMATTTLNVEAARRIKLRPLSAKEVVRILKAAGREDAIPEGRVVTQGIAAITGFALGLTKGIGGTMLLDLATSNATQQFINNFNYTAMMGDFQGINMTALMQMLKGSSATNSSGITYQTTEICFETTIAEAEPVENTVARSLHGNSEEDYGDEMELARQATVTSPPATSPTNTGGTGTDTNGATNTGAATATGTATGSGTDTGTGTNVDTGTETNTNTNTVTETGGGGQTCIVIQKPKLRKRRSMRGRRRRSPLAF